MRIGVIVPTFSASAPVEPERVRRLARLADEEGLDHLFVGDHLVWNVGILSSMATLAHLAAVTHRIELGVGVYLLTLRQPVVAAKDVASVDVLSGGRLILGIGSGGEVDDEYEAAGVDRRRRGDRMEDSVRALRTLLSDEPARLTGMFGEIPPVSMEPRAVRPVPLWMGGRASVVVDRAARIADGWFPVWVSAKRYAAERERVLRSRTEGDFRFALNLFTCLAGSREEARATAAAHMGAAYRLDFDNFEKYVAHGTAEDILAYVADYQAAGVTDLVFNLVGPDPQGQLEGLLSTVVPRL